MAVQANTKTAIVAGSAITASAGIALGVDGGKRMLRAATQFQLHESRYKERHAVHLANVIRTNEVLHELRRSQHLVRDAITRIHDFIEGQRDQVLLHEDIVFDVSGEPDAQAAGIPQLDAEGTVWVPGVAAFRLVGDATPAGLTAAIGRYATASTGKPIRDLYGAAAERAIRAAAGGGSKASGGGGMQIGDTMFKVAKASAYVFVGGAKVGLQGVKAQAAAEKRRTAIEAAIVELDARDFNLEYAQKQAADLNEILIRLISQATGDLETLDSEEFEVAVHGKRLQSAMFLVTALQEMTAAQVVDGDGNLGEGIAQLIDRYGRAERESDRQP